MNVIRHRNDLNWEREWDWIKKNEEWIMENALGEEDELDGN